MQDPNLAGLLKTDIMKKLLLILFTLLTFQVQSQVLEQVPNHNDYFIPITFSFEGNNMLVGGKFGKIYHALHNGFEYVPQGVLIDLEPRLNKSGEQGLLSVEIYNNQVYALFTALRSTLIEGATNNASASILRVVKWDLVDGQLVNERYIVGATLEDGIPILSNNHVGGTLQFLSDGTLLISTGTCQSCPYTLQAIEDGIITSAYTNGYYKAQQLGSLQGKILRVDNETGLAPLDNPHYPSRVYMRGLRNPFRFSVYNDYLYIGDVGEARFESIKIAHVGGSNLGFPFYEGIEPYLSPNMINADLSTSFANLITEATSFEDTGEWQVRKASLAYGRFQNEYTKIVTAGYSEITAPDIATGISVVVGIVIPELNALVYNDYFLNKIYFATLDNNYISGNIGVNTSFNSITQWKRDSFGDVYAISASNGLLKLNLETLSIDQIVNNTNEECNDEKSFDLLGRVLDYPELHTGVQVKKTECSRGVKVYKELKY